MRLNRVFLCWERNRSRAKSAIDAQITSAHFSSPKFRRDTAGFLRFQWETAEGISVLHWTAFRFKWKRNKIQFIIRILHTRIFIGSSVIAPTTTYEYVHILPMYTNFFYFHSFPLLASTKLHGISPRHNETAYPRPTRVSWFPPTCPETQTRWSKVFCCPRTRAYETLPRHLSTAPHESYSASWALSGGAASIDSRPRRLRAALRAHAKRRNKSTRPRELFFYQIYRDPVVRAVRAFFPACTPIFSKRASNEYVFERFIFVLLGITWANSIDID